MQPALTLRDTKTHRTGCFILTFVFVPALLHATLALMIIGATVVHIFKKLHADWLWLFFLYLHSHLSTPHLAVLFH